MSQTQYWRPDHLPSFGRDAPFHAWVVYEFYTDSRCLVNMAFLTRCIERGTTPRQPYGFRGEEFIAVEVSPMVKKSATGVTQAVTDEDYISIEFSAVFQVLPTPDELSPLSYASADYFLKRDKPMVFSNWKDRALNLDTRAVTFLGILHDMLADPEVARTDPDAAAQISAFTRGISTLACDDRGFRNAHHGMLVEYIPTDSGYAPDGHESYSSCLFRPVYAEEVSNTPMFLHNMPNHIACMEAMKYFKKVGGPKGIVVDDDERAAVLMHIWDKTKLPSMNYISNDATVELAEFQDRYEKISNLFNIDTTKFTALVSKMLDYTTAYEGILYPFVMTSTPEKMKELGVTTKKKVRNVGAANYAFIGSPQLPSMTHHMFSAFKNNVTEVFPVTAEVWAWHDTANISAEYPGKPYQMYGARHCVNLGVMDYSQYTNYQTKCKSDTKYGYLAVNPDEYDKIFKLLVNNDEIDSIVDAITNSSSITDAAEKIAVKKLADEIHTSTRVERFMTKMNHVFNVNTMPYFMQHAHARRFLKEYLATAGVDKINVSETVAVECTHPGNPTTRKNVSLASALAYTGPATGVVFHAASAVATPVKHALVDTIDEMLRAHMKRHRTEGDDITYDTFNDVEMYETVMKALENIPVRRHRIIGKFMGIEGGGGGIIIQLGAPNWVY